MPRKDVDRPLRLSTLAERRARAAIPKPSRPENRYHVLSVEGREVTREPYSERRRILEQMQLGGPRWQTPKAFDDGAALWAAVCEHKLEDIVAKRRSSRYISGERGWVKTKNGDYWRYELDREGAFHRRRRAPAA